MPPASNISWVIGSAIARIAPRSAVRPFARLYHCKAKNVTVRQEEYQPYCLFVAESTVLNSTAAMGKGNLSKIENPLATNSAETCTHRNKVGNCRKPELAYSHISMVKRSGLCDDRTGSTFYGYNVRIQQVIEIIRHSISYKSHEHSRFDSVPKLSEIDMIASRRDTAPSLAGWTSLLF